MKTKLLRKLRKEANNKYRVIKAHNMYFIEEYVVIGTKSEFTWGGYVSLPEYGWKPYKYQMSKVEQTEEAFIKKCDELRKHRFYEIAYEMLGENTREKNKKIIY